MRVSRRAVQRSYYTTQVQVRARGQIENHMPGRVRVAIAAGSQPARVPQ